MLYQAYTQRMQKLARIRDAIYRRRYWLAAGLLACLVALTAFLLLQGWMVEALTLERQTLTYGTLPDPQAEALFSSVEYEYRTDTSDGVWSTEVPRLPGEYRVRAVSVSLLGIRRYSEEQTFTITPISLVIGVKGDRTETVAGVTTQYLSYGTLPSPDHDPLPFGDSLDGVVFSHDDLRTYIYYVPVGETEKENGDVGTTVPDDWVYTEPSIWSAGPEWIPVEGDDFTSSTLLPGGTTSEEGALQAVEGWVAVFRIRPEGVRILAADGTDVTDAYVLTFEDTQICYAAREVDIYTADAGKIYDGTALAEGSWRCEGLAEGDYITLKVMGTQTEAGKSLNTVDSSSILIVNAAGQEVTRHYRLNFHLGTLTVSARPITVATGSAEKWMDGTPLSCPEFGLVEGAGTLVEGDRLVLDGDVTSISVAAIYINKLPVEVYRGTQRVTDNYRITYDYGTLTIKKKTVVALYPLSLSKYYDGTPLSYSDNTWWTLETRALKFSHTYDIEVELSGEITDVGSVKSQVKVVRAAFYDAKGNPLEQYELEVQEATLTVMKRPLTLCSPDIRSSETTLTFSIGTEDLEIAGMSLLPEGYRFECTDTYITTATLQYDNNYLIANYKVIVTNGEGVLLENYSAGQVAISFPPVRILDPQGRDVTGNFDLQYEAGYLTLGVDSTVPQTTE